MSMLKKYWKWIGGLFIGSAYASTFLIGGAPPDVKLDSVKSNILNVRLFERTELFNCQGAPISCERRQIPMVEYQYYSDLVVPEADEVGRTETTVTVRRNGKDITSFSAKPHSRIINGQWRKLEYEKATRSDYEATLPIVYEFINRALATVTTFNASGTWDNSVFCASTVENLVIGGGGGGGIAGQFAGGGGAGGMIYNSSVPVSPISYSVTVGLGGTGGPTGYPVGGDSIFSTSTAKGGGGGGDGDPDNNGGPGGSGGGGHELGVGGQPTAGQGKVGFDGDGGTNYAGGGGGKSEGGGIGFDGGDGEANSITGSAVTYAGGGGGAHRNQIG